MNFILESRLIIKKLLNPDDSLTQRVASGGFWAFSLRILDRIFQLGKMIVLARLLVPNDFGLLGIAVLTMTAIEALSQTGINQALIQRKDNIISYLDTAWTIEIIRGFFLATILFYSSSYIAVYFTEPAAISILKITSLVLLIKGLANVGIVYFRKEIDFRKNFILMISCTLADVVVSVVLAFLLKNVWALVYGLLAREFTRIVLSYIIHPYRPKLSLNWIRAKELLRFGRWVSISSIITFASLNLDSVIIGRVLGASILGLYQMALKITNLIATDVTHVIGEVMFPAYSIVQDQTEKLQMAFLSVVEFSLYITLPLTVLIILLGHHLTITFLGTNWLPMVSAMQILAAAGLIRSIVASGGAIYQAIGLPKLDSTMNIFRLFVLIISIYPLIIQFGMLGVAISVFLSISTTIPIWFYYLKSLINISLMNLLKVSYLPIILTLIVGILILFLKQTICVNTFGVLASCIISLIVYLFFNYLFWRFLKIGIFRFLNKLY
jgi:O-antigen/teichoic acid export membrane protein